MNSKNKRDTIRRIHAEEDTTTIRYEYMEITPEQANEWLKNNMSNRPISYKAIVKIADAIEKNKWCSNTIDPIAFYEDGTLANGQHRLKAIVKANKPVSTTVAYGIAKEDAYLIDGNRARSVADSVVIATGNKDYTPTVSSAIRLSFVQGKELSKQEHLELYEYYKEDIKFLNSIMFGLTSKLKNGITMAAMFTAQQAGVNSKVLTDFAEVMKTNITVDQRDITVTTLILWLLSHPSAQTAEMRKQTLMRTQQAIWNYERNRAVTRALLPSEYKYPMLNINDVIK